MSVNRFIIYQLGYSIFLNRCFSHFIIMVAFWPRLHFSSSSFDFLLHFFFLLVLIFSLLDILVDLGFIMLFSIGI